MKKLKQLFVSITFAFALLLALPAVLPNCSSTIEVQAATVEKSYTLFKGVSFRGSVNTNAPTKWKWTSSNPSVVSVSYQTSTSNKPKVTAKNYGSATITGTYGGNTVRYKVTVAKISKTNVGLYTGSTHTLSVTGSPASITWKSSNTSVATVSSKGKITAKKAGTAKISAVVTSKVGKTELKKTFSCTVTVRNKPVSVQTNLNTLKNTISKSSLVNSKGNHYIRYTKKSKTMTYKYYVVYDKAKDRLQFSYKCSDSASKKAVSASFYVYNTDKTYKISPVISATTPKGIKFTTTISLDRRNYTKSTKLTFAIKKSNVKLTDSRKESMQSISNSYLKNAFEGWNTLVYKKTKLKLNSFGFTQYK